MFYTNAGHPVSVFIFSLKREIYHKILWIYTLKSVSHFCIMQVKNLFPFTIIMYFEETYWEFMLINYYKYYTYFFFQQHKE